MSSCYVQRLTKSRAGRMRVSNVQAKAPLCAAFRERNDCVICAGTTPAPLQHGERNYSARRWLMVALSCFGVISVSASGWCMRNICMRCRNRLRQRRMRLRDIWSVERGIPAGSGPIAVHHVRSRPQGHTGLRGRAVRHMHRRVQARRHRAQVTVLACVPRCMPRRVAGGIDGVPAVQDRRAPRALPT